jgi:hypothetical protein
MNRLLVLVLLAAVACGGKSSSTTPKNQNSAVVDAPLGKATFIAFAQQRFPEAVMEGTLTLDFGSEGMDAELVKELDTLGIHTTRELAAIVPADYQTKGMNAVKASADPSTNITGLIRDLLIIHDMRGYFTKAWNNSWSSNGPEDFPAPAAYGVDFKVMEELGVFESGDGGEYDPCMDGVEDPCAYGDPCDDPCGG